MVIKDVWENAVVDLQMNLSKAYFESYIKKLKFLGGEKRGKGLVLKLGCPSVFIMGEVKRRCGSDLQESVERVVGGAVAVEYEVDTSTSEVFFGGAAPLFTAAVDLKRDVEEVVAKAGLKKEMSLETFAVSSSNEMAYAAAKAVSQSPGTAYNPLFLYGGVGVGKTHLMQAIGRKILEDSLELKTIYCSGEEFTNEIIDAIRRKSTAGFKRKYRSVKLLLIDDIQFIAGKTTVQEEFFHTFNAILNGGGQVIMTSDKPPKEIDALEERLRSRFEGGLTIDIGQPNFELRTAIIMIKSRQMGLLVSAAIAQAIAEKIEDTRELIGALTKLSALTGEEEKELSLGMVERILKLKERGGRGGERVVKPEEVIGVVADFYGVESDDVVGARRLKNLVFPRHVAMFLLVSSYKRSLVEVGSLFGGRDHTTVMHAVGKVGGLLKKDDSVKEGVAEIRQKLGL